MRAGTNLSEMMEDSSKVSPGMMEDSKVSPGVEDKESAQQACLLGMTSLPCVSEPQRTIVKVQHCSPQEESRTHDSSLWSRFCYPFLKVCGFRKAHTKTLRKIFLGLLGLAYLAFFITACYLDFQRALGLVVLTCLAVFNMTYNLVRKRLGVKIIRLLHPLCKCFRSIWPWLKGVLYLLLPVGFITFLVLHLSERQEQLVSVGGVAALVLLLFLFSRHHRAVSWRTVVWGLTLQFLMGVVIIWTEPGFLAFQWFSRQITVGTGILCFALPPCYPWTECWKYGFKIPIFLNYTLAGSRFVFGDRLIEESFAFLVLPIIIFFSCVTSVLYYVGAVQWVVLKISWLLQITMNTTPTESLSTAGNVFLGMTEAILLIHPYLPKMTRSEIHAMMTGGFSTIAGGVMAAYVSFGIDASSLIAASVMAAPCSLAMAKLVYPEVEESKLEDMQSVNLAAGEQHNILEAVSCGASISVGLVGNIAANLIAFLAMLAFTNSVLAWLGQMVNISELSFEMICSYVLIPVVVLLGISWEDAPIVAELLGIKIFLNEFLAYQQLSTYKKRRLEGLPKESRAKQQWISVRAEIITTYALCGFANLGSTGIMLGALSSLAPQRRSEFASIIPWSLFTGACVSLINACIAGILYVPRGDVTDCSAFFRIANLSSTSYPIYVCCHNLFSSTSKRPDGSVFFTGPWQKQDVNTTTTYLQQCCSHYKAIACDNT